jgi:hypothetical protein
MFAGIGDGLRRQYSGKQKRQERDEKTTGSSHESSIRVLGKGGYENDGARTRCNRRMVGG